MAIVKFSEPRFAVVVDNDRILQAGFTQREAEGFAESYNALADKPCRVVACQILVNLDEVAPC